jgi:hypothetical protein
MQPRPILAIDIGLTNLATCLLSVPHIPPTNPLFLSKGDDRDIIKISESRPTILDWKVTSLPTSSPYNPKNVIESLTELINPFLTLNPPPLVYIERQSWRPSVRSYSFND